MKKMLSLAAGAALALSATASNAAPMYLVTHNNTNVESNAWVNGNPSPYATKANSTNKVFWSLVEIACIPVVKNGICSADVKMETETAKPVMLGRLSMNLKNGDITPKSVVANGYRLTVNGPAEVTLTKE